MKRTKEEAEATRQALLQAALTVFSERGYAETTLEDIASKAGVTRGAIYHHFGGKPELFSSLIQEISGRISRVIDEAIAPGGTSLDIFRRILIRNLEYLEEDDEYRAAIELANIRTGIPSELAAGMRLKIEESNKIVVEVTEHFQMAIEAGDIRADLDPQILALSFLSLQHGLINMWLLLERSFSLKAIAPQVAEVFIQGISPNSSAAPSPTSSSMLTQISIPQDC